jgi:histidyl-tRNA synthetase
MNTETVKGFNDYLGEEARKRQMVLDIIKKESGRYGFEIADTPIVEFEEFARGENQNDEAVRDIFRLQDRGERKLALRYEFTFQLKRIAKNQKLPFKRFQLGYVFRDEPTKKGRTRQFVQCDADVVGSGPKDEAECLAMAKKCFDRLKIPVKIYVNNRKLMNEILDREGIDEGKRGEVIREIDKLDKLEKGEVLKNLKGIGCSEKILEIFLKGERFFERYDSYVEVKKLKEYARLFGLEIQFRPFLARGLSYYNGSVFEIWSDGLGVALAGGGSYLVDGVQSTGISLGIEPIVLLAKVNCENKQILIVSLGQDKKAIEIAEAMRARGNEVNLLSDKSPSKALDYANSKKIMRVVIVGENEVKSKKYSIKEMGTGSERFVREEELKDEVSRDS